jgi:hypothetical protein
MSNPMAWTWWTGLTSKPEMTTLPQDKPTLSDDQIRVDRLQAAGPGVGGDADLMDNVETAGGPEPTDPIVPGDNVDGVDQADLQPADRVDMVDGAETADSPDEAAADNAGDTVDVGDGTWSE